MGSNFSSDIPTVINDSKLIEPLRDATPNKLCFLSLHTQDTNPDPKLYQPGPVQHHE
ncbi:hypothetical protein AG1IA_09569 [Rhizoctonia solani AG-1 IA]|uniref:Uncharacterized protein n=1 Tax=Thanatephorus cucumeris (strain AG1-IA) TaxID=983506 RepID=L8WE01_THACA|nr:hypothetical protein AG1IA_09569 [Rhizoctonia solani AG-1 IA]